MRKKRSYLRKMPQAALVAVLSMHLSLPRFATATTPDPGTLLEGTYVLNGTGSGVIDGQMGNGFFVKSGSLTINNATLTNFRTLGGDGSGGGAGMGGALFINEGATVILNNVNFTSNAAKGGAGGVGTVGGSLNNLFRTGDTGNAGANGITPAQYQYTDINGTTGTKGYNGATVTSGFGGVGGNGGAGGNGGDRSESLILGVTTATTDVAAVVAEVVAASSNPFTANVAIGLGAQVISAGINLGNAIAALAYFDQSLADGQIGLGGTGGVGGNAGNSGFGFGGVAGGNGGDGGKGGSNWGGSLFQGGAAGGDAGSGGIGGMGGFGAGGGSGGNGGTGGAGASLSALAFVPATPAVPDQYITTPYVPAIPYRAAGHDENGNPSSDPKYAQEQPYVPEVPGTAEFIQGTPAKPAQLARLAGNRPSGADGAGGAGGAGGFGGGAGTSGTGPGTMTQGGNGGNGYGGGIFVRAGATLIITGNALFDGNGVRGGDGQAASSTTLAGMSGIGVGTDLFMMKGSTVILDPGAGNVITFNGDPYGTSIADDSASSIIPSGGTSPIASGSGAGITIRSGLVQFNGGNVYSGVTKIEGGTLQAQDGEGIYWDSAIQFAGTRESNAVLMSNGTFSRYVGTQSNRVHWTGSGGFAAVDGELDVRLSNGATLTWGAGGFVGANDALIFGSEHATDKVNVLNAINLNGGERTILVVANADDTDHVVLKGVLSNGSLTVGDASHTGTVVLAANNTYTGLTKVAGGTLTTLGDERIHDSSTVEVASGARFLVGGNETVAGITGLGKVELGEGHKLTNKVTADANFGGELAGAGTLMKTGAGKLTLSGVNSHTGTIDLKTGSMDITGSVKSSAVNVSSATTLKVTNGGLDTATVLTNDGTVDVGSVNDSIAQLINTGTLNGSSTLTATTYDLKNGSVINANLGAGTVNTTGTVTLKGSSNAANVNVASGSTLNLQDAERLNDTATVDNNGTVNLNAGSETVGAISGSGAFNIGSHKLTSDAATDSAFSGTINGSGSFTKDGAGKLTLSGSNTYTGTTTVAGGTLATSGDERIANNSNLEVQSGATFELGGNEHIGSIAGAGMINLAHSHVLTTTSPLVDTTFSGVLSGTGTLTKEGSAKLTLSGTSTATGTLNVNGGSIDLTGSIDSSTVNVAASAALNSTTGGLATTANVTNSGTLNIGSANDTIATLVNIGTVNGSGVLTAATYNLNNGSVINANLGAGTMNTTGAVTFNGTSTAEYVNVALGSTLSLQFGERLLNSTALTVNGTMTLNGGSETVGTIAGSGTINLKSYTLVSNAGADTTFSGVVTGTGGLTKNGTGKLTLSGTNTYTGVTLVNSGTIDLTGSLASNTVQVVAGATLNSTTGGLASGSTVSNAGTLNIGAANDSITTLHNTGTINGTGTLTAGTYNLNGGSIIKANLGSGTLNTTGIVDLYGSSAAAAVNVAIGSVLNLHTSEILLNTSTVTVNGTLNLLGGDETIDTLLGNGVVNTNAYQLFVTNGGAFQGTLNATNTNLNTGNGGGGLVLDGGTTNTNTTTVDNNLTLTNGATLNSAIITLASGSVLDLSGGGTINFTTLTSLGSPGGTINIGSNDFIIPVGSSITGFITFIGTGNIINNGTISPGFSPGLTLLPGAAPVLAGGSTFSAELAGLGGVAGTDFDQIQLTTPGATLTIGGTLAVAGFGGFTPVQGNTFQIVAGPGGALPINPITGTFAAVTFDADGALGVNPAVTNAAVVFDVNTGLLTATGLNGDTSTFGDLGSTPNQRAAASAIFNAALIGPNQINTATTAGQLALQLTDATSSSSADLARYVPEFYGSMSDYALMGDVVMTRGIQDRVSSLSYPTTGGAQEDRPANLPAHGSAYFGYVNSHIDTADSANVSRNDYYVGANVLATDSFVLGLAGSVSEGSLSSSLGSAESNGFGGMVYARASVADSFSFFGSFGLSQQDFDLTRATVNGTVTGSTDATTYVGFLGAQYKGWQLGEVSIAPRLSLTYASTDVAGFSESGAIDALTLAGYSASRLIGEAGMSALWTTEIASRPLSVELAASLQQMLTNNKDQMTASIATVPNASYPIEFNSSGDTQAVIRANASYTIFRHTNVYGGYEGHYGGETAHYIKAGCRIDF